jgi:signal peptidase II
LAAFFGVAIAGVALDLWTKSLAVSHLAQNADGYVLISGVLNLRFTRNFGAVFGLGQGGRSIFIAVSIGAVLFLSYLFSISGRQRLQQIILGMLLAGVLGNMYDRIAIGYVRDMIWALPDWPNPLRSFFPNWQTVFPWIFKVADTLLCVGVAAMLIYGLVQDVRTRRLEEAMQSEAPNSTAAANPAAADRPDAKAV